ncbi:carboxypeptidase regulatory-like domain-containing protein [Granulicella cerasi]|uniref:carboxypeptidase regulatory-like domain-containing protein n=1 Tax=Granulicella cerasi TaxID=741063 RepID=UPI0021E0DFB1|nr:carboxypeptidase regulatory-like domain-containing protein [Granulicella cerasi]
MATHSIGRALRHVSFFCTLLLLSVFLGTGAFAQTSQGSINGEVKDATGALVPGALVTATNTDTHVKLHVKSNSSGLYTFTSLVPGPYEIEATAQGFSRIVVTNITVSAAQSVTTNVQLATGSDTFQVTVESADSLLSKDVSDVSTTVDHALIESLPYPEQSALEAALLVPGVTGDPLNPGGIATENPSAFTSYVLPGANITVGGSQPGQTALLIDGSDVMQASYPRSGLNLSGRNVGEMTVVTSGMSAKYGRTSSGAIVMSSAAGTSKYHGSVTWRHTDPWWNAYPLGGTLKNNIHENYYGFYLNGPLYIPRLYPHKDKTFFEVSFEPARLRNRTGQRTTYFTPAELQGKFNDSLIFVNQTTLKTQGWDAARAAPHIANSGLYNHASGYDANGFPAGTSLNTYTPVPGGPITDCSDIWRSANPGATTCPNDISNLLAHNAFAQFVIGNLPTPSNPGPNATFDRADGGYQTDGTNGTYARGVYNIDNRYNVRIDHVFNNSNQIYVRFTSIPVSALRYFATDVNNPLNQTPTDAAHTYDVAIGYTRVLTNTLVSNFHYSWLRVNQPRKAPPSSTNADYAAKYGLTPAVVGYGLPSLGNFAQNGYSYTPQIGVGNSQINIDQNFIVGDDITWTWHRHQFQFGGDMRWYQSNQYDLSGLTGGKYSFAAGETGNGTTNSGSTLASFIQGTITSFTNTPISVPGYYRWRYYAGYFQDDWRALPSLTINIGVRYEVETPRMEKNNNQAFMNPSYQGTVNSMASQGAFCFSGACGTGQSLWPTNHWGLEPRVGISWAPTRKSTIRASYTIGRPPLSGQENIPDPNLNVGASSVGGVNGGTTPGWIVNYITNPIPANSLKSAYTALNGQRGPFNFSTGISPVFVDQSNAVPYVQTWGLTLQYQPLARTVVQVSYQGVKGTHLYGGFNYPRNTPALGVIVAAVQAGKNLAAQSNNTYNIRNNNNDPTAAILQETALQKLYPYQNFFNQTLPEIYPRRGTMHYNAIYVSVNQRLTKDLTFLSNWSWSKSLDNVAANAGFAGGFGTAPPQNPFDTRAELSLSSFDQPSRFRAGYSYSLPFGFNRRFKTGVRVIDQIIGGFTTSGIASMMSGFPNYVALGNPGYYQSVTPKGVDQCNPGGTAQYCVFSALPAGYTLRPNRVPGVPVINPNWKKNPFNSLSTVTPYLNPAAFSIPGAPGAPALGNVPRTMGDARSPREFFFDMRVAKDFKVYKKYRVQVNANFSNVFNHPVYFGVNGRTLLSSFSPDTTTGKFPTVPNNNISQYSGTNVSFGTLAAVNTQGISRVVRFGAEFNF